MLRGRVGASYEIGMGIEMDQDRQLFIFGKEIWDSISYDDVKKTISDMDEMNILKPPFQKFDLQMRYNTKFLYEKWIKNSAKFYSPPGYEKMLTDNTTAFFRFDYTNIIETGSLPHCLHGFLPHEKSKSEHAVYFDLKSKEFYDFYMVNYYAYNYTISKKDFFDRTISSLKKLEVISISCLLTLLATKNIIKETVNIKKPTIFSMKRNKQKYKNYDYVTTIKIGEITETLRSDDSPGSSVRPHLRRGHIRNQHFGEGNKETKKIFIQPIFVNADEGWIANNRKAYKVTI
jgi:hypothetical protein